MHTGLRADSLIKTSATFSCQIQDIAMDGNRGPAGTAGMAELTEIDTRASGHVQPVGRAAFLQEDLDVSVAVDQGLGSIG